MYYCRWLSWRKKSKRAREEFLLLLLLSRFLAIFLRLTLTQLGNPAFPTPVYGTVAPASGKRDFCISPASLPFSLLAAFQLPSYPTGTICRTVLQPVTKFSAHCHISPREARNAEQQFRAVQAPFLPSGHAATSSILQFAEPWRHVQRNGYLPGIAALRSRMLHVVLNMATESALLASK